MVSQSPKPAPRPENRPPGAENSRDRSRIGPSGPSPTTGSPEMAATRNPEQILKEAIAAVFAEGGRPTHLQILAKAKPLGGATLRQLRFALTKWAGTGEAMDQASQNRSGRSAYIFAFGGADVETASLRNAIEPELVEFVEEDGTVVRRQRQGGSLNHLRAGLRLATGVAESRSDQALLAAAERISAYELIGVPQLVFERALESGVQPRVAQNYRSAVRRCLRDAVVAARVPAVFDRMWEVDEWEARKDEYFGSPLGNLDQSARASRTYWEHLATLARAEELGPDDLTVDHLERFYVVWKASAKGYRVNQVKTMLRKLARERGVGPYAEMVQERGTSTVTRNGWMSEGRLLGHAGEAHTGSWPGFLSILRAAGYSEEVVEFFDWYGDFIALDDVAIEAAPDRFPVRPPRWYNGPSSITKRIICLRMILGLAPEILDVPAANLSLEDVFGRHHRLMIAQLRIRWQERAARGRVSDPHSDGLEKMIIAYGLVARALYLRAQHARDVVREAGLRLRYENATPKTDRESILWTAAMAANETAKSIAKHRREKAHGGSGDNSVKSIVRIIENTPAQHWIAVLDDSLRLVRSMTKFNGDGKAVGPAGLLTDYRYHSAVADTYYLAILVSTGMRIIETAHVRLDVQYTDVHRIRSQIALRSVDRKWTSSPRAHTCTVHERFVPRWLEDLYLEVTRPFFMVKWPQTVCPKKKEVRGSVQVHQWLFVDRKGRAIGCTEEDASGERRDKVALMSRLGHLRRKFKAHTARIAVDLGLPVPIMNHEGSNHAVRAAMGYAVYQRWGLEAAANFLGDLTGSIEGVYTTVDSAQVNMPNIADDAILETLHEVAKIGTKAAEEGRCAASAGSLSEHVRAKIDETLDLVAAGKLPPAEAKARIARLTMMAA